MPSVIVDTSVASEDAQIRSHQPDPQTLEAWATQRPDDFAWSGDKPGWCVGPTMGMRDGMSIISESNAHVLLDRLKNVPHWQVIRCSHWGFGWVDILTFKVWEWDTAPEIVSLRKAVEQLAVVSTDSEAAAMKAETAYEDAVQQLRQWSYWSEKPGARPTLAACIVSRWNDDVEEYPVLDDCDVSKREYEGFIEHISSNARNVKPCVPDDYAAHIYNWLFRNKPEELITESDGRQWIRCEAMTAAIEALGFADVD